MDFILGIELNFSIATADNNGIGGKACIYNPILAQEVMFMQLVLVNHSFE